MGTKSGHYFCLLPVGTTGLVLGALDVLCKAVLLGVRSLLELHGVYSSWGHCQGPCVYTGL